MIDSNSRGPETASHFEDDIPATLNPFALEPGLLRHKSHKKVCGQAHVLPQRQIQDSRSFLRIQESSSHVSGAAHGYHAGELLQDQAFMCKQSSDLLLLSPMSKWLSGPCVHTFIAMPTHSEGGQGGWQLHQPLRGDGLSGQRRGSFLTWTSKVALVTATHLP